MERRLVCYHLDSITSAPSVEALVKEGKLIDSVGKGMICDWRVPIDKRMAVGQDVACVGPEDPNCPEPKVASYILVGQVEVR